MKYDYEALQKSVGHNNCYVPSPYCPEFSGEKDISDIYNIGNIDLKMHMLGCIDQATTKYLIEKNVKIPTTRNSTGWYLTQMVTSIEIGETLLEKVESPMLLFTAIDTWKSGELKPLVEKIKRKISKEMLIEKILSSHADVWVDGELEFTPAYKEKMVVMMELFGEIPLEKLWLIPYDSMGITDNHSYCHGSKMTFCFGEKTNSFCGEKTNSFCAIETTTENSCDKMCGWTIDTVVLYMERPNKRWIDFTSSYRSIG